MFRKITNNITVLAGLFVLLTAVFASGRADAVDVYGVDVDISPDVVTTWSGTVTIPASDAADPDKGIYKFGTLVVESGAVITFEKNKNNTPIYIIASGDIIVDGKIHVNGGNASGGGNFGNLLGGTGGAGGFDGGDGGTYRANGKRGGGPGGGEGGDYMENGGSSHWGCSGGNGGYSYHGQNGSTDGSYCAYKALGGKLYGNAFITPFVGGSGGGGGGGKVWSAHHGTGAGGGGGAMLLATAKNIIINSGAIVTANGGRAAQNKDRQACGGNGSGGALRLIADTIIVSGVLDARNSTDGYCTGYPSSSSGHHGYVRLEANNISNGYSVIGFISEGTPREVFPSTFPTVSISTIGGINVPAVTRGTINDKPDVELPINTPGIVPIVIATTNIPTDGSATVTLRVSPKAGAVKTFTETLTANTVTINAEIMPGTQSILYVEATYNPSIASLDGSDFFVEGEKVEMVKVSSVVGGKSTVTYITESGKEIPAVM